MGIKQAKEIIGICIQWNFWMMGLGDKPKEKLNPEISLKDLIKANECIVRWNERQRKKYSGTGKSFSQHQTLADRMIAAIYTALNFSPNGEAAVVINGLGVGVIEMKEK